jgi:transposase-like protein
MLVGAQMKRTPGKSVESREKYWTKRIEAARRHPKGITDYCRQNNLSKNNYYSWFKRLRKHHPEWHDLTNYPEVSADAKDLGKEATIEKEPSTEVLVKPRRRKFTEADRALILEETDNASSEQLAAVLRREGIYVHTLNKWRTQRDLLALTPKTRGPKVNYHASENKKLRDQNARLEKKLLRATEIIKLQKKISKLLGMTLEQLEEP